MKARCNSSVWQLPINPTLRRPSFCDRPDLSDKELAPVSLYDWSMVNPDALFAHTSGLFERPMVTSSRQTARASVERSPCRDQIDLGI
jgi:hypothetical protein